jgi:hypothetical protein
MAIEIQPMLVFVIMNIASPTIMLPIMAAPTYVHIAAEDVPSGLRDGVPA